MKINDWMTHLIFQIKERLLAYESLRLVKNPGFYQAEMIIRSAIYRHCRTVG